MNLVCEVEKRNLATRSSSMDELIEVGPSLAEAVVRLLMELDVGGRHWCRAS